MSITENNRLGDLLKYELDKNYCREVVTIASGQNLKMGTVLGISNGKYTAAVNCTTIGDVNASGNLSVTESLSNTGGTISVTDGSVAITGGNVSITNGTLTITGGTSQTDTDGEVTTTTITGGAMAVTGGSIAISGGTVSVIDGTMSVTGGTSTITGATLEIDDGTLSLNADRVFACAVLMEDCDASTADKKALVLRRSCIVDESKLIFPTDATDDNKKKFKSDLARSGILARKSVPSRMNCNSR